MTSVSDAREGIEGLIRGAPGRVGLAVKDLSTGEGFGWSVDERFPAASVIKLPVLVEALHQEQEGKLSLQECIPVRREDKVGGFGILKEIDSLEALSLLDLLTLMTIISDNTAANLCIERVGMAAVNDTAASLGMKGTLLQRKMMDMAARERGLDNFTTPGDVALLLETLVAGQALTPEKCDLALSIMKRQQVKDRLPLLLPAEVEVAHKTGELNGVRHDVGVLFVGPRKVVVAALTSDFATPLARGMVGGEASALIAEISRRVYEAVS